VWPVEGRIPNILKSVLSIETGVQGVFASMRQGRSYNLRLKE
jgi:hypothetical protein